jgi:chaperone modulatory protein CbpM
MNDSASGAISGYVLGENDGLSLAQLCALCQTEPEFVFELVEEGVLEVQRTQVTTWRFRALELRRTFTAARLQRDLGVNAAGAALALQLLEDIETLQRQVQRAAGAG